MRIYLVVPGLLLALCSASARAQVAVDVAKITCDQYVHAKIATPNLIAAWLSGYYNGQKGNRTIDLQTLQAHVAKLEHYCYQQDNFKIPVMTAVETAIGAGK